MTKRILDFSDGFTSSSAPTGEALEFDAEIELTEIAEPTTPASGKQALYVDTADGDIKTKDDTGTVVNLTAGGATSVIDGAGADATIQGDAATNLAGGPQALAGGSNCSSSGNQTLAFGLDCTAVGNRSVCIGDTVVNLANNCIGLGRSITLNNPDNVGIGVGIETRGSAVVCIGSGVETATGADFAQATGNNCIGRQFGLKAEASGLISTIGDAQGVRATLRRTWSVAGGVDELFLNGSTVRLAIGNTDRSYAIRGVVVLRGLTGTAENETAMFNIDALIHRADAASAAIVGQTTAVTHRTAGDATTVPWAFAFSVVGNDIHFDVTGTASETMHGLAYITFAELA